MNPASRGLFLCPDCGVIATVVGRGEAMCSECQVSFGIPEDVPVSKPQPKKEVPEKKEGSIRRNISLREQDSSLGFDKKTEDLQVEPDATTAASDVVAGEELPPHQRRRRKRKSRPKKSFRFYACIGILWAILVSLVFFVVMRLQREFDGQNVLSKSVEQKLGGEDKVFYRTEFPAIHRQMGAFLNVRRVEGKFDFCLPVSKLTWKMRQHYVQNEDEKLTSLMKDDPSYWNVAYEESPGFVEVVFEEENGKKREAVFVKSEGRWLLDWEQFVRYSDQSWILFRQHSGDLSEGIFRLYVEKVTESQEGEDYWIKVRLYGAIDEPSRRDAEVSSVIMIEGDSPIAGKLDHLFVNRIGESDGYSKLWKRDPKKLRRATLKLAWKEDSLTGEDKLVIEDVLSHHWRTLSLLDGEQ